MDSCCLCSQKTNDVWNDPLFESQNFVVLPSLGALVQGWLLLAPKQHFICMGSLSSSLIVEMQEMKRFLYSYLHEAYGRVYIFEHGPSRENLSVGCGVDHAHLHFVPLPFDPMEEMATLLPNGMVWSQAGPEDCQAAFNQGKDYLYMEQPIGVGRIATHHGFGSQLFRRAIAARIGTPNQFNWREYPQISNVLATIDSVRAWRGGISCAMQPSATV